jgi:deoxyribodipyrimidine photolyase-related protein
VEDVKALCDIRFADHPGDVEDFWLPVQREACQPWLEDFVEKRLGAFGPYQDAIHDRFDFNYHAVISPMVNVGLMLPDEVCAQIEVAFRNDQCDINSAEGFIRQVIGWREFIRGIYQNYSEEQDEANFFDHKRLLNENWYTGETGIPPLDDAIKKSIRLGYAHHIERLMILSNIMLLARIDPREVHRWFMEMFVDSSDWVMGPNVYGMGQFSDGGIFATKPYVCGSNYILKMSHYKKGDWCDTLDGLYWRFIEDQRDFFEKNPRMKAMTSHLDRMDDEKRARLWQAADVFLEKNTKEPD